jgi:hypothetical protein
MGTYDNGSPNNMFHIYEIVNDLLVAQSLIQIPTIDIAKN